MTEPRLDRMNDDDLKQLYAERDHLAGVVAETTGLTVPAVLDQARQAVEDTKPLTWAETVASTGSGDTTLIEIDVNVPGHNDPRPVEIPLADARALYIQLGGILAEHDPLDDDRRARYEAAFLAAHQEWLRPGSESGQGPIYRAMTDAALPIADAEQAGLAAALQRTVRRLDNVLDGRERERRVMNDIRRENERLRGELETLRNGASDRAAILEETRDILEQAGYPQAHADDWPRLAPAVSALTTDLAKARRAADLLAHSHRRAEQAEAAITRVRALHQPVTSVAAAKAGIAPDCGACDTQPYPCPTIRALDDAEPARDSTAAEERAAQAEEDARRALAQRQEMAEERYIWQQRGDRAEADLGQAKIDRDQARAEGTALKTALTEVARQARLDPDAVECVHAITDRWKYNSVSNLAQYADTLTAALDDPETT